MSQIEAHLKEAAGYVCEEVGEIIGSDTVAVQCRRLRNEGRIANGKPPKLTPPGTENKKS